MSRSSTTGLYTRVDNSFSNPVVGTTISPTDADSFFDDVESSMNAFIATSASSVEIGTGTKNFTVASDVAGKAFLTGTFIHIWSRADSADYMFGTVTSYSTSTGALVVDVTATGGSGTNTDWNIMQAGARGATGATGATGPESWATPPTAWLTATAYSADAPASVVTEDGECYVCATSHTSGTFATDLAAVKWIKIAEKGADGAGTGDVTGQASSVDSEIALFSGTGGKTIKRATTTGILKAASGVIDAAAAGTDYLAPAAIGVTVQAYDADTAKLDVAQSWTAKQTFGTTTKIDEVLERVTITADNPASGDNNFDVLTQAIQYYTTANDTNWTLNVRGDGSTSLDTVMATGEAITIAVIVTNTGTAYYQNGFKIDGSSVTPQWLGAAAPSAGTVNKRDTYTFTIIKTGSATFIVQASFAAGN